MHPALAQLLNILQLQALGDDRFAAQHMHPRARRLYGGQVLAQACQAAFATVAPDRVLHSQHAYFLRPGNPQLPLILAVERARDGGSFSSRRVVALQNNKPILVSSLSFQTAAEGDEYQTEMPQVEGPESLLSERERELAMGTLNEDFMITNGPDLDVRCADPIDWLNPRPREPSMSIWMKTTSEVAPDPRLHQALLAYMSDCFLIDVALIAHGRTYQDKNLQIASLDHAIWFHQPLRADQWLLQVATANRVGGGRGLSQGQFYSRDGRLVATTMQESLLRRRTGSE